MGLPIHEIQADIVAQLGAGNRLVLVAPTGSGKTTQVPQMLLDAGLADRRSSSGGTAQEQREKKIVVLQPRRVAARTVAARVARERRCRLGGEVGYQIRFEDATSLGTRICFVTEGILLRWLQEDRTLPDVGIILFDEFHERNLFSDVALALAKQLQQTRRPDLKLGVMSATLEAEPVAAYLDDCPILTSEGESYPVEVHYQTQRDRQPIAEQAADAVERILRSGGEGDILVFMPGMGEIQATINAVRAIRSREPLLCIPLHGELPPEEQDRAFAPSDRRKVVVATNVAETSVTIEGIRHVVDSGLARIARFDADRGVQTLFLEEISRASAEQRKGRAGRTAPGTCYRLWTESNHLNRPERNTPEIQRSDLAEVVLLLHSLHIRDATRFDWLDQPDPQAVERAEALLRILGALDPTTDELSPTGRAMLRLPMHPRYSRMLVEAAGRGCVRPAALCAALVSGRDLLRRLGRDEKHIAEARELFEASSDSDFFTLMRAFQWAKRQRFEPGACRRYGVQAQVAQQVDQTFQQIWALVERGGLIQERRSEQNEESKQTQEQEQDKEQERTASGSEAAKKPSSDADLMCCLAAGFVDQLAVRRGFGTLECDLTEGRVGTLVRESVVSRQTENPLLVAAGVREVSSRQSGSLTLLGLATVVRIEWFEELFPEQMFLQVEYVYDREHKRVEALKRRRFRDLVIQQVHLSGKEDWDPEAMGRCLAEAHRAGRFELPEFNHEIRQWIARVNLVATVMPELELPAFDEAAIVGCLSRAFRGLRLAKEAKSQRLREYFMNHLPAEQLNWLEELTPRTLPWPDGTSIKLVYPEKSELKAEKPPLPEAQVKLHGCFALKEHPHVCEGRLPVKLILCAPNGKRVESTADWLRFKSEEYPRLKGKLKQQYPGVAWP